MTNVGSVNCCFYFTFFKLEIIDLNLYMASIFCFPCLFFWKVYWSGCFGDRFLTPHFVKTLAVLTIRLYPGR